MFQRSKSHRFPGFMGAFSKTLRSGARSLLFVLSAANALHCEAADQTPHPAGVFAEEGSRHFATNAAQFRTLSGADYLEGCDFHLNGTVTLVDTNRNLVVLQDATGAVALNFRLRDSNLHFGQFVSLNGTNCFPYFARFPDYPYRPSRQEIRNSFEAPTGRGDYYLTRMRGYLHPPATGEYVFWIASDNSSELWLSVDASVSRAGKIASVPRFGWTGPREWSHYPSQRSKPIGLKAGVTYYIEALQEQTTVGDNLAVAWQGPGLEQSVIDGRYLTPWGRGLTDLTTNGILREFWTNYMAGDLTDIGGARPFQSALSVENVGVQILDQGQLPKPDPIVPGQPWRTEDNYRWVTTEGLAKFIGAKENAVWFELARGPALVQVRTPRLDPSFLQRMHNVPVRVEGVCEGVYDKNESLTPGVIWVSGESNIHFIESAKTNVQTAAAEQADTASATDTNPARQGFYSTRGVVTFNDRVLDKDYLVVQEDESAMLVSGGETSFFQKQLKVGEWVELGGAVQTGKYLPVVSPLVITELGWHSMPVPITEPLGFSAPASRAGQWSQLEGVAHSVNSNGILSVVSKDGPVYFGISRTPANELARYVDAKLRVRGVLLPNVLNAPLLLIPSRNFVDVEEPAPENPFAAPKRPIADFTAETAEASWSHRARVAGEVIYREAQSFFIQDNSGGIRVLAAGHSDVKVGDTVEVLGFPTVTGAARTLTEALVRPAISGLNLKPKTLDLSEALLSKQSSTLVVVNATLLARKTNGPSQVLELQEQQRVFAATFPASQGSLPNISPGSRLQVIGVCDNETAVSSPASDKPVMAQYVPSLNILLRGPGDVIVLNGPPWWTWKRAVLLVGTLLAVLAVTLLWVHQLRRRLERQQAAQLAFSRQILERLEDERRRIAVNLHDSLGQILLVIKNHALLAIQRPPDEQGLRQRLDEISGVTSQAIEEVRQITHGLRPYQLDRLGLTQAIRASVSQASANRSILFASRVEDIDGLFDKEAEIHVYRIVQEAVTNVVKHSAATEAAVVIKKRSAAVLLSIRDNGHGFDPAKPSPQPRDLGYGLTGITERVRILGGTLTIDSRPGGGTSVTVEVPLPVRKT
jgi:signal transduction histidine kinase